MDWNEMNSKYHSIVLLIFNRMKQLKYLTPNLCSKIIYMISNRIDDKDNEETVYVLTGHS